MVVEEYPVILRDVNTQIANFISTEKYRVKSALPALGEFLPLMTIANYSWEDIAVPYLEESFDRNALWTLSEYPELERMETTPYSDERLRKSFDASQVSLR
jgi:hypothetical protein